MKKRSLVLAAALMAAVTLAGCGGSSAKETTAAEAKTEAAAETKAEEKAEDTKADAGESKAEAGAIDTSNVDWPTGTIDIIVPGSAGGNSDLSARVMVEAWEKKYPKAKFNVVDENTGSGTLAMEKTRTAKNDGSTIIFTGSGSNIMYHQKKYQYSILDPDQFTIIAPAAGGNGMGSILLTQPDKPYSTLDEFVEYCKAHPGEVSVGTSTGTTQEIKVKLLMEHYGLDVKYVVVSGNDTVTSLLAGNLDVGLQNSNQASGYIENGDLKGLVNNTWMKKEDVAKDFPALADVDTYDTLGLLDIAFTAPMYIAGPGKMDPALVQKINEEVCAIADDPESVERWASMKSVLNPCSVEEIQKRVEDMDADVAKVLGN